MQKRPFPQKLLNVSNTTLDIYVQGQCAVKVAIIFSRHLLMGRSLKYDIYNVIFSAQRYTLIMKIL